MQLREANQKYDGNQIKKCSYFRHQDIYMLDELKSSYKYWYKMPQPKNHALKSLNANEIHLN